ncbi:MAG: YkgJ family cysteine cluster protein [Deltaproteobacteria bacterium]|nr:YkgJ family cysteine cluster protein [Deltaproteobacteria bacterium]
MIPAAAAATDPGERFRFTCQPGMACFTRCCANLNLVLTPYDILRLKRSLGVSAEAFLDRFATASTDGTCGLPVVRLRMDPETGRCPFVTADGCRVYADRPGACRLYPLGQALKQVGGHLRQRYFAIREPYCLGWDQGRVWRMAEWLADQGLDAYQRMNTPFLRLSTGRPLSAFKQFGQQQLQMYFMACYNLDAFREFVAGSSLKRRFALSDELCRRLREDDEILLFFAGRWLEFALFGAGFLPRTVSQVLPAPGVTDR